ncbi:MAG: hypothetical protein ACRCXC_10550 [Legionella sp.]
MYSKKLGIPSLKGMIVALAKEKGRKISILDSGCGQCVAVNQLLSDEKLKHYIDHISGISLHSFYKVYQVMENHHGRFYYYLGAAQNVLAKALEPDHAFDLILDIWGAYPYSEDKLGLLKQYH